MLWRKRHDSPRPAREIPGRIATLIPAMGHDQSHDAIADRMTEALGEHLTDTTTVEARRRRQLLAHVGGVNVPIT